MSKVAQTKGIKGNMFELAETPKTLREKKLYKKQKRISRKLETMVVKNSMNLIQVNPLTKSQKLAFESFQTRNNLILHGSAGTGKSFVGMYLALKSVLLDLDYSKLYIVRSAVPTRDIGFLKGSIKEKSEVYEAPYRAICSELFNRDDSYEILKQKSQIEFMTTSYLRGITLDDCIVLVDECQNMTFHELDSIITRIGKNCRVIVSGDTTQSDFTRDVDKNGVKKFMKILSMTDGFDFVKFTHDDIVRGPIVKSYIITKEQLENENV